MSSVFLSLVLATSATAAAESGDTPPASTAPGIVADADVSWVCLPAEGYAFTDCDKMCSTSEESLAACEASERRKKPALTRFRIDGTEWRSVIAGQATCIPVRTGKRVRIEIKGLATFSVRMAESCATREYRVGKPPCGWTADCVKKADAKALRLATD